MRTRLVRTLTAKGMVSTMLDRVLSREPAMSATGTWLLPIEGARNGS